MHHLLEIWFGWVLHGGYLGIIVLMAMESSIFPVPSEIVIPPAAFLAAQGHLSFAGVIVAGSFGSYLGAAITYCVSRVVGRPVVQQRVHELLEDVDLALKGTLPPDNGITDKGEAGFAKEGARSSPQTRCVLDARSV